MRMDINYRWADWSENYEVYAYYHQHYSYGMWYDSTVMSYDEAIEEIKKVIRAKAIKDHPHLNLDQITKTPDMPVFKDVIKPAIVQDEKSTLTDEEQIIEGIKSTTAINWLELLWSKHKDYSHTTKAAYEQQENKLKQTI